MGRDRYALVEILPVDIKSNASQNGIFNRDTLARLEGNRFQVAHISPLDLDPSYIMPDGRRDLYVTCIRNAGSRASSIDYLKLAFKLPRFPEFKTGVQQLHIANDDFWAILQNHRSAHQFGLLLDGLSYTSHNSGVRIGRAGEFVQMASVSSQMACLPVQEVALYPTDNNENSCKEGQPERVLSQFAISIFFLLCLGGVGLLGGHLYYHGRRILPSLLIASALGLWVCYASWLIFGSPFAWLAGHTDCQQRGNCEYRQMIQHDGENVSQIYRLVTVGSESISSMNKGKTFFDFYGRCCQKFWEDSLDWPRDNVIVAAVIAAASPLAAYLKDPHQSLDLELIKTTLLIYLVAFVVYITVRAIRVPWKLDQERIEAAEALKSENFRLLQCVREAENKLRTIEASTAIVPVQHIHLPAPLPAPPLLKHNVQCLGVEVEDISVIISFQNVPIPAEPVGEFKYARLCIEYMDGITGIGMVTVFPARWIEETYENSIDITPRRAFLAAFYGVDPGKWRALPDVEGVSELSYQERVNGLPLRSGCLLVKATLVGEKNLTLAPVTGFLTLHDDGQASWEPRVQ